MLVNKYIYIYCRTPVWPKTFGSAVVQEEGGSVHSWCAGREIGARVGVGTGNKGKGGAGLISCRSADLVGTLSGTKIEFLGTFFGQSGCFV